MKIKIKYRVPVPLFCLIAFICLFAGCSSNVHIEYHPSRLLSPDPYLPFSTPASSKTNIILFIGDGMHLENEIAASRYLYGTDYALVWNNFPKQGFITTWDVDTYNAFASYFGQPSFDETTFTASVGYDPSFGGVAPYPIDTTGLPAYLMGTATDSASAATAMATGFKTNSGNISWRRGDPPGGAITTIEELMRSQKKAAIGVVSTVPFNHATPAAFVSHNVSRGDYSAIADEIIGTTRPDVVIGGGHPSWCGGCVSPAQLDTLRNSTEYTLVERIAGQDGGATLLTAANALPAGKKLFGLFGGPRCNLDVPVPNDNPGIPGFTIVSENPSLAQATEAALTVLGRNINGFIVMIEQGEVDLANHGHNYAGMIGSMWSLDRAVQAAIDYVNRPGDNLDWTNTLLIVTADHATGYMRLTDSPKLGVGDLPAQIGTSYPDGEVTYGSGGHTSELVTIRAKGDKAGLLDHYFGVYYQGLEIMDNTQVFELMAESAGIVH